MSEKAHDFSKDTNLEVVPIVKLDNSPVDKKTQFTIKEVKFNEHNKNNKLERKEWGNIRKNDYLEGELYLQK